jgi:hypothetical protein
MSIELALAFLAGLGIVVAVLSFVLKYLEVRRTKRRRYRGQH